MESGRVYVMYGEGGSGELVVRLETTLQTLTSKLNSFSYLLVFDVDTVASIVGRKFHGSP